MALYVTLTDVQNGGGRTMYITVTNIQNRGSVSLSRCIENQKGVFEVALCQLTYYPHWFNISTKLHNNLLTAGGKRVVIPDGYYNVCELDDEFFQPHGASLQLHSPTGRLQIKTSGTHIVLPKGLQETLGFTVSNAPANAVTTAENLPLLAIYREVFVHLNEVSTSQNSHNGVPSTLLRSVPVENEKCGSGRTISFSSLQYKQLTADLITEITVRVLDEQGHAIDLDYLSAVLHLRETTRQANNG